MTSPGGSFWRGLRGYIEYYGQLREARLAGQDLFDAMVARYPDWVSRQQFLILGTTAHS